tara:strand:- start:12005 stop:19081 length:7077 start_codon:yes stop_codon:yes gene_type:complete
MPEIKHTFIGAKMNKDLDERLVPNGEYREANNIQVRTTDTDAAGTAQNIKGNTQVGSFREETNPETQEKTRTVGSVKDEKNDKIYFFQAAPPVGELALQNVGGNDNTDIHVFTDSIIEQDVYGGSVPVFIDEHTIVCRAKEAFNFELQDFVIPSIGNNTENTHFHMLRITDLTLIEKVRVGMKVEIFDSSNTNRTPNLIIRDIAVHENGTFLVFHAGIAKNIGIQGLIQADNAYVKFTAPKVLNFDYSKKVTAINVIDRLLFWSDGANEPKKINIDRSKAGTQPLTVGGEEYVINGDFSEDITININSTNLPANGWAVTGGLNGGFSTTGSGTSESDIVTPSVYNSETDTITNSDGTPPGLIPGKLYLNKVQHFNPANHVNNGSVRRNVSLTPGVTYTYSFDYNVISGTLKSDLNGATNTDVNLTGTGVYSLSFTAATSTLTIIYYANTSDSSNPDINVTAYIDNVSVKEATPSTSYKHTKLFVKNPKDIASGTFIPVTDLAVYNNEGDSIDDNIKEEHITVIRKAPTVAPSLILNETDRGEGNATSYTTDSFFVSPDSQAITSTVSVGDIRVFTDTSFESTIYRVNDILLFTSIYTDATIDFEEEIGIDCKFISYLDADQQQVTQATNTIKVEIIGFSGSGVEQSLDNLTADVNQWEITLKQKDPLFELKLGRFSCRYKYEDGEYSSFGPFSDIAFLPGFFNYQARNGYNVGMKNNVREIILKDFIPFKTIPLDVCGVDILYKPTNSANCFVVKSIERGVDAEWELFTPNSTNPTQKLSGQLSITSEAIHTVLSEDQVLRTWDNVPRYAQAQEITANRLLYGNYVQGYDIQLPVSITQEVVSERIDQINSPNKSLKTIRDYKWGVVFGDKYGRETPVFTSSYSAGYTDNFSALTGDVSLDKKFCEFKNHFKVKQQWTNPVNSNNTPPDWAEYVKYYVKESSNEYYNLVLNRWYYADEFQTTAWLSFQSTDRSKLDEETYLILKTENGTQKAITTEARYNIIAIENTAPDFIKTKNLSIGSVVASPGDNGTGSSIWSSGNGATSTQTPPDLLIAPGENGRLISVATNVWLGLFGLNADGTEVEKDTKISLRIRGEDQTGVPKYTRWTEVTNWNYATADVTQGGSVEFFNIYYADTLGDEANMFQRFVDDVDNNYTDTVIGLTYYIEFKKQITENKPEFDGRFFVKVEVDSNLETFVLKKTNADQQYIQQGIFNVDYVESESTNSAVSGDKAGETWNFGEGNGWWFNAFDIVDDFGYLDNGVQFEDGSANIDQLALNTNANLNGGSPIKWKWEQDGSQTSGGGGPMTGGTWQGSSNSNTEAFSLASFEFGYQFGGYPLGFTGDIIPPSPSEGLAGGFAFYCWRQQTIDFWTSRKSSVGSRPFLDKAAIAGTKVSSYQGAGSVLQVGTMTIGNQQDQKSTGLDAGSIDSSVAEGNAVQVGAPSVGLGRMCLAVCGYDSIDDLNQGDRVFMQEMGTLGTLFRFAADQDNVYRVLSVENYVNPANNTKWHNYYENIQIQSDNSNNNNRIGIRINFRKVDENLMTTSEGIDVNTFDPRGLVRHDGTEAFKIEILRNADVGGDQIVFEEDLSVFETEPKEDVDLDIYYEASNAIPIILNEENINNFSPIGCGITVERLSEDSVITAPLPGAQTTDIINQPAHQVTDLIAKPRIFNEDLSSDLIGELNLPTNSDGTQEFGIGDPIIEIKNLNANGDFVDYAHGIYVGDTIVFHHKNGMKTRSKVTGFYEKKPINQSGNVVTNVYAPREFLEKTIQAIPNDLGASSVIETDAWFPYAGTLCNKVNFVDSVLAGDFVAGEYQLVEYVQLDANDLEVADSRRNAPPGIVINLVSTDDSDNVDGVELTSSTATPFYFQTSAGVNQTRSEFETSNVNGIKFKCKFLKITDEASPGSTDGHYSISRDVWKQPVDLNWFNCYSYGNGVESDRIRDSFNAPRIDNGVKVSTTFSGYKEEQKPTGLIYSGLYNSTSELNSLNEFNMSQKITKDLNPTYGSIQALKTRDTDVVVFTEDKVLKVLSNKDALFNADGNPQLTATERVLGQAIPFVGDYGISKNPESLATDQYRMYFADAQRGAVLRLSMDGLTPISNVGMKTYFRENLRYNKFLLGTFDTVSGEYNLTIDKSYSTADYNNSSLFPDSIWEEYGNLNSDLATAGITTVSALRTHYLDYGQYEKRKPFSTSVSYKPVTVSFSEESKGWVSFKSFVPEAGESVAGCYTTASKDKIWKHYTSSNYNNFYGVQYESDITVLFNDNPGLVKSFKTVSYEGSQGNVEQNLADTDEFYNLTNIKGWQVELIETDKQSGSVNEFIEKEGKWYNKISGLATTISNLDTGEFTVQGIGNPVITPVYNS